MTTGKQGACWLQTNALAAPARYTEGQAGRSEEKEGADKWTRIHAVTAPGGRRGHVGHRSRSEAGLGRTVLSPLQGPCGPGGRWLRLPGLSHPDAPRTAQKGQEGSSSCEGTNSSHTRRARDRPGRPVGAPAPRGAGMGREPCGS